MGKINLIDQLRSRSSGDGIGSSIPRSSAREQEVEFEELESSSGLDAYEKRRVVVMLFGVMLVLGGRQLVPTFTVSKENLVRNEINNLEQSIASEKSKTQKLKMVQDEMRQYDSRVADLQAKLQKVKQLDENRNLLVRMTDYIVKEMPQRLWFDRVDVDTRSKVLVSGYSTNYQIVSEFMKKLEGAVYFPQWRLVQTENRGGTEGTTQSTNTSQMVIQIPPESKRFELEAEAARL